MASAWRRPGRAGPWPGSASRRWIDVEPAGTTPDTYTLHEIVPPTGYVLDTTPLTIQVLKDKAPAAATFFNDPVGASVRVGDYLWIDKNHDGLQDDTRRASCGCRAEDPARRRQR